MLRALEKARFLGSDPRDDGPELLLLDEDDLFGGRADYPADHGA